MIADSEWRTNFGAPEQLAKTTYPEEQVAQWDALLRSDLETLFRLIVRHQEALDEGSIRAASPILRRWLIEGLLDKFCRAVSRVPKLPALNNEHVVSALQNAPDVTIFLTGGVRFNGAEMSGIYSSSSPFNGKLRVPAHTMKFELFKLGAFKRQKRIYFSGRFFTCEEIIKFVANKLGGVHFDAERDETHKAMEAAADAMTFGGPPNNVVRGKIGQMHLMVEPSSIEPLNAFHIEIIAAAASLLCLHLDGKQLIEFNVSKTLTSRISNYLGLNQKAFRRSVNLIERSK
ncbi:MAG: hypothetical protein QM780_15745 [Hyphomicrobium sp.]|uniref:hypothetical protein n=1 Tax=Hyphomicrobium sp. TaxID=82 RepID=UPI0039E30795